MAAPNCIHAFAGPQLLSGLFALVARVRREHAIRRTARELVLLNRRRLESLGLDHGELASAGRTKRDLLQAGAAPREVIQGKGLEGDPTRLSRHRARCLGAGR